MPFNSAQSDFAERVDEKIKRRETLVARKAARETKVNLLGDCRDFERAENVIKKNV